MKNLKIKLRFTTNKNKKCDYCHKQTLIGKDGYISITHKANHWWGKITLSICKDCMIKVWSMLEKDKITAKEFETMRRKKMLRRLEHD